MALFWCLNILHPSILALGTTWPPVSLGPLVPLGPLAPFLLLLEAVEIGLEIAEQGHFQYIA